MKKLLEILGTIIISGSGMAGLVGNAPASAKNEINYLQANNLENLNRNKRETIEANRKIKLEGCCTTYKGELKLNSNEKKINFTGNNQQFHQYWSTDA